jgi:hypothetical protein
MGVRFDAEVLRHFYPGRTVPGLQGQLESLSREVAHDSAAHMRRAIDFVSRADLLDDQACRDFTVELARSIAARDLAFLTAIRTHRRQMDEAVGTPHATSNVPGAGARLAPAATA